MENKILINIHAKELRGVEYACKVMGITIHEIVSRENNKTEIVIINPKTMPVADLIFDIGYQTRNFFITINNY